MKFAHGEIDEASTADRLLTIPRKPAGLKGPQ